MSLEKIAQDAYTQGVVDTLRNMNIPDEVKIAAYKEARALPMSKKLLKQMKKNKQIKKTKNINPAQEEKARSTVARKIREGDVEKVDIGLLR